MKSRGSILIVVLGLLAILAIVGVTFVTMSSMDRTTASNFAVQSQFMLAADGAIDYVCQHLIQDLWEYDPTLNKYKEIAGSGTTVSTPLLSNANQNNGYIWNEPWDYPGPEDPWLATTITRRDDIPAPGSLPTNFQFSYGTLPPPTAQAPYGLDKSKFWGANSCSDYTTRANNLGFPGGDPQDSSGKNVDPFRPGSGVWIPDLSFPFETGLIRVSVTVQDHGALVNLNAHGNAGGGGDPDIGQAVAKGYFISDVDPQQLGFDGTALITGLKGRWSGSSPANPNLLETVIENPVRWGNHPFTLDEEVELRRLNGTAFTSRLESVGTGLVAEPRTATLAAAEKRLRVTTVGWTSEVRVVPYTRKADADVTPYDTDWTPRKADINLDIDAESFNGPAYIYRSLVAANVVDPADTNTRMKWKQFCANIAGFASCRPGVGFRAFTIGAGIAGDNADRVVCASRQPVFYAVHKGGGDPCDLTILIFSPWEGDYSGDREGLSVTGIDFALETSGPVQWVANPGETWPPATGRMPKEGVGGPSKCYKRTLRVTLNGSTLSNVLKSIKLTHLPTTTTLDIIDSEEIKNIETQTDRHRKIGIEYDDRCPVGNDPTNPTPRIRAVYFGDWTNGEGGPGDTWTNEMPAVKIPVRFPRSCGTVSSDGLTTYMLEQGLPPIPLARTAWRFRAFPRLGDLNQVLWIAPVATATKPWVVELAQATRAGSGKTDKDFKFDWWPTGTTAPEDPADYMRTVNRLYAANVLSAGGPWLNRMDDDGDGYTDEYAWPLGGGKVEKTDRGTDGAGQFAGPELRVAGKINLNTVSTTNPTTLEALQQGTGVTGLATAIDRHRSKGPNESPAKRILTPAVLLTDIAGPADSNALGDIEKRDVGWSRISNIVTTRSDTFSIYGTVQYIDPVGMAKAGGQTGDKSRQYVRRSRRFWALVDRSPCLAYQPSNSASDPRFLRPRVMNFQWLD